MKYFRYNGEDSTKYELINFTQTDMPLNLQRNVLKGNMNRHRPSPNHMGTQWADVLVFDIGIMKDPCAMKIPDIPGNNYDPNSPVKTRQRKLLYSNDTGNNLVWSDKKPEPVEGKEYYVAQKQIHENGGESYLVLQKLTVIKVEYISYIDVDGNSGEKIMAETNIEQNESESMYFTQDQVDNLAAWLTSPHYPTLLHIYDYNDTQVGQLMKYDYFGLFSDVKPEYSGNRIIGLTATFTTNAPYAWSHQITKTLNGGETSTINVVNSDREAVIYPVIKIVANHPEGSTDTGKIEVGIKNETDNGRELKVKLNAGVMNVIDCNKAKIYTENEGVEKLLRFNDLGLKSYSYIYWPRLFNGENKITVTGTADVTMIYREPRKVGAY